MELPHALHRATPAELKARMEAERRGTPFVLYRDGDGVQRIVELADAPDRLPVGRRVSNGLALAWDEEVSRVHAVLERTEDEWAVVDDGRSRNGTFLNGERINGRRRLADGDVVRMGRSILQFRSPGGRDSLRTATAERTPAPPISEAQRRVLTALCRPYADSQFAAPASNQEIASELFLSVETVKSHLRALFDAFGVADLPQHQKRAALAQRALDSGVGGA
jgi:pSer/pThr/pTyr-binding forkhead associated (FHA) protein